MLSHITEIRKIPDNLMRQCCLFMWVSCLGFNTPTESRYFLFFYDFGDSFIQSDLQGYPVIQLYILLEQFRLSVLLKGTTVGFLLGFQPTTFRLQICVLKHCLPARVMERDSVTSPVDEKRPDESLSAHGNGKGSHTALTSVSGPWK